MPVDHINLTVESVREVRAFLQKHFECTDAFEDNNDDIAVLADGHGMYINLMRGKEARYPKAFHVGFAFETEAEVNAMYSRLTEEGVKIKPPKHAWGSWTFHFMCPGGGFIIEVACTSE